MYVFKSLSNFIPHVLTSLRSMPSVQIRSIVPIYVDPKKL